MYLLDTDTIIYSLKGEQNIVQNLAIHMNDPLKISVIVLLELYYGAYKSQKKNSNLAKVRHIEKSFDAIPVDFLISETFGMLKSQLGSKGTLLDDFDLIIAATALAHNLTLVSNNEKHFRRIEGLKLVNWNK